MKTRLSPSGHSRGAKIEEGVKTDLGELEVEAEPPNHQRRIAAIEVELSDDDDDEL